MPNNNLLSLIMDPEDKQIQSFTNASWVHSNHLLKKSLVVNFHHISPTPPRFSLKKKRGSKICVYKNKIWKICCNQKFPPKSSFSPTILPKKLPSPKSWYLLPPNATSKAPAPRSGSWSIHPARPQASTTNPPPEPGFGEGGCGGNFFHRSVHSTENVFDLLEILRNSYHVWRAVFQVCKVCRFFFNIWHPHFGFPRCFSVAKSCQWKISMRWSLFLGNSHQKISYTLLKTWKYPEEKAKHLQTIGIVMMASY